MESEEYLTINNEEKSIELSEKGQTALDSLKNRLLSKISSENLIKNKFIKAVIISDDYGKVFLSFEGKPDYIKSLVADETYINDPHLISMFFSAIKDFGRTLDKKGFSEVKLSGENLRIIIINYQKISGIFFTDNMDISDSTIQELKSLLENLYITFSKEITEFSRLSTIHNIKAVSSYLNKEVNKLNEFTERISGNVKKSRFEKLIKLYNQISSKGNVDPAIIEIKNNLFKYIITEDPTDVLTILTSILKEH